MATAIYRPDSIPGPEVARLAPSPKSLAGLRIAVLDNGKPNAGVVMTRVAETLAARVGAMVTLVTKKGPRGESANAAIPCAPDVFERVLAEADLVLTGAADCGSCTAYSVVDAIALEKAGVLYAVAGGNAVALWVTTIDEAAVRNTRDVDIQIRRSDLEQVRVVLENAGFCYRKVSGIDLFLDGPDAKVREAMHIVFAGEMVRPGVALPNPDVTEAESTGLYKVLNLRALVQIKWTAYRDQDRTQLRDMLEAGLIDTPHG